MLNRSLRRSALRIFVTILWIGLGFTAPSTAEVPFTFSELYAWDCQHPAAGESFKCQYFRTILIPEILDGMESAEFLITFTETATGDLTPENPMVRFIERLTQLQLVEAGDYDYYPQYGFVVVELNLEGLRAALADPQVDSIQFNYFGEPPVIAACVCEAE